jgi:trehalose 6-phosphate synthase/phosphatase
MIFVSNRLPATVRKGEGGLEYLKSIGGLATGLKGFHEQADSIWVGWPGISDDCLTAQDRKSIKRELRNAFQCMPVFLSDAEVDRYYHGFCNKTIWPLFHYFQTKTEYDFSTWEAYEKVNRKFFSVLAPLIHDGDIVWIHDYQLMLLPRLVKEKFPNAQVGFFLHIPFPSVEIFRLLIWREEILRGMLGADLIGFHTYDYMRYFLSSVRAVLGLDHALNKVKYEDRYIQVGAFPMGIDYERFSRVYNESWFLEETEKLFESSGDNKIILSIDRLDYTKGIPERLSAFDRFLMRYPEYRENVRLYLIVAPSREEVDSYESLRRRITEKVGEINGRYGTLNWMPVWFFYQSFSQENLIAFYRHADVMLVTPLRDGMNLVVKEYIAARSDFGGMAVISETAGAASELGEAVIVNPNNYHAVAGGIKRALEMPEDEKIARNKIMHKRLQRYNVEFWAEEFLSSLQRTVQSSSQIVPEKYAEKHFGKFRRPTGRRNKGSLFLDYDGTLVDFAPLPEQAKPDKNLRRLLRKLTADPKNTVVIVSGRDRRTLSEWFDKMDLYLLAEHGLWLRAPNQDWSMNISLQSDWKECVRHVLELYSDRLPGSFIEEKDYALALHYRQSERRWWSRNTREIREALLGLTQPMGPGLMEGNKVLEVKDTRANKGFGASLLLQNGEYDFILAAGDDNTDEDLFLYMPRHAFTIKVGLDVTRAEFRTKSWISMRQCLGMLNGQA